MVLLYQIPRRFSTRPRQNVFRSRGGRRRAVATMDTALAAWPDGAFVLAFAFFGMGLLPLGKKFSLNGAETTLFGP